MLRVVYSPCIKDDFGVYSRNLKEGNVKRLELVVMVRDLLGSNFNDTKTMKRLKKLMDRQDAFITIYTSCPMSRESAKKAGIILTEPTFLKMDLQNPFDVLVSMDSILKTETLTSHIDTIKRFINSAVESISYKDYFKVKLASMLTRYERYVLMKNIEFNIEQNNCIMSNSSKYYVMDEYEFHDYIRGSAKDATIETIATIYDSPSFTPGTLRSWNEVLFLMFIVTGIEFDTLYNTEKVKVVPKWNRFKNFLLLATTKELEVKIELSKRRNVS